jgi:fructose-bisphosphate aldolase class I
MDGDHDIDRHAEVTEAVQHAVFHALYRHHVALELMILKPNMVLPGQDCRRGQPDEVAEATLKILRRTVPASVPSINFLSGGQGPEEATANLNAINQQAENAPWQLSISYGRALQQNALQLVSIKQQWNKSTRTKILKFFANHNSIDVVRL